jgi:hypothetical protein
MNFIRLGFGLLLVVGMLGCTTRSEPGGGADKANTFTLSGPDLPTSIKKGETQTVAFKVERGKEFKSPVALKTEPPAGVVAELSTTTNQPSEKGDVNIKITPGDNAQAGEHIIQVVGTPSEGAPTKLAVRIKVLDRADSPKETGNLSLSGPLLTTTVKQGETKTIEIKLKHTGKKYDGNVMLKVEGSHKGIATKFTTETIKPADSGEVGLIIAVDKSAELGEHALRITGTPDSGTVAPADVKLKVVAP